MARDFLQIKVTGDREVLRALRKLPDDAERELRDGMTQVSQQLAERVRAAGFADTRQSARAASTVQAVPGTSPRVQAGPHPMLFGSEFGILRRTGWYAKPRYLNSPERQYRPHRGSASYWFFRAQEDNQGWIDEQWRGVADAVVRDWNA